MPNLPFVLVVDDDRNIAYVLAHLLRSAGYRAEIAPSALDGIALARKERPDVILMDMKMPVLGGATAAAMIQDTPELKSVPIILMSAMPEEEGRRRAAESGAADFIAKPFYRDRLLSAVRRWTPEGGKAAAKPKDDTRVLVVDDDPAVRNLVAGALREVGLAAWEAHDAREALRLARELVPGLIITDVAMPGIDGTQFCLQLKSSPRTSHIPVIFISGNTTDEAHELGAWSGGAAYFDKPLDMGALLRTIRSLLRTERAAE